MCLTPSLPVCVSVLYFYYSVTILLTILDFINSNMTMYTAVQYIILICANYVVAGSDKGYYQLRNERCTLYNVQRALCNVKCTLHSDFLCTFCGGADTGNYQQQSVQKVNIFCTKFKMYIKLIWAKLCGGSDMGYCQQQIVRCTMYKADTFFEPNYAVAAIRDIIKERGYAWLP